MKMRFWGVVVSLCVCLMAGGCTTMSPVQPGPVTDSANAGVKKALDDFRSLPQLQSYFEQAKAIVIVSNNFRAGTGFGGAVGKGWLIEDDVVTASVWHWQFLVGADLGFQFYRQILFLKDDEAVAFFKNEPFQFAGQANATAFVWGEGATPSYNDGVALFTLVQGGLLLEASVGMHSYHVFPYP